MKGAAPRAWPRQRGLFVLACTLLLCACAGQQRTSTEAGHTEPGWSGRMYVRVDTQPPQSFSAAFDLQGSAQEGQLQLRSPLGNTLASAHWSAQGAQLRAGPQSASAENLAQLSTRIVGTELPVGALFEWLQGRSGEPDTQGWQVDLSQYAQGRIQAQRTHSMPAAELRIILQPSAP